VTVPTGTDAVLVKDVTSSLGRQDGGISDAGLAFPRPGPSSPRPSSPSLPPTGRRGRTAAQGGRPRDAGPILNAGPNVETRRGVTPWGVSGAARTAVNTTSLGGASTYRPLITPALFSHRPPPDREKRENSRLRLVVVPNVRSSPQECRDAPFPGEPRMGASPDRRQGSALRGFPGGAYRRGKRSGIDPRCAVPSGVPTGWHPGLPECRPSHHPGFPPAPPVPTRGCGNAALRALRDVSRGYASDVLLRTPSAVFGPKVRDP
jgi:hypothetical protein